MVIQLTTRLANEEHTSTFDSDKSDIDSDTDSDTNTSSSNTSLYWKVKQPLEDPIKSSSTLPISDAVKLKLVTEAHKRSSSVCVTRTAAECCNCCSVCKSQQSFKKVRLTRRSLSYPFYEMPTNSPKDSCKLQTSRPTKLILNHNSRPSTPTPVPDDEHLKQDRLGQDSTIPDSAMQHTLSLATRVSSLFTFGVLLAILLNFLQKQKRITVFSPGLFGDVLNSAWWIPPTFGIASTVIGLLYPFLDNMIGKRKQLNIEWSSVMRCIALFVGFNHAIAKIDFQSNIHLTFVLAVLSIGLWYFFDQSLLGLGLGIVSTSIATIITQLLVALNVFGYSDPDFIYMRSWVPWLYFSGMITVGTVGRALASLPCDSFKEHQD